MELFHANQQWATRPVDERFTSVQAMHDACKAYASTAAERDVVLSTLRVEALDGDVRLVGKGNVPARLTNWAFKQLCARVGAPAGYLDQLPATLAAQNINHGMARRTEKDGADVAVKVLFHRNGELLTRCITSEKYTRFWNWEITERLLELESVGWGPARPDVRDRGDGRLPLYASDHDMFAFMARADVGVREPGNPLGLKRGIIVSNSEVGAGRLRYLQFLYREMCGNHIIWGAENVLDLSLVHVGDLHGRMAGWYASIDAYINGSAAGDEARIVHAQNKLIAGTKEEVLDTLFGTRSLGLSRKTITAGYEAVVPDEDGDPRSVWGMAQGLTRYSQTAAASGQYADARIAIDKAAGKLIDLADAF